MVDSELAAFLRARLDELETAAWTAVEATGGARWGAEIGGDVVVEPLPEPIQAGPDDTLIVAPMVGELEGAGWHVALHSPARVLADIDARRALIDQCLDWQDDAERDSKLPYLGAVAEIVLSLLALPWTDHPDYQSKWHPI